VAVELVGLTLISSLTAVMAAIQLLPASHHQAVAVGLVAKMD
jgi:hypothetical protein